MLRASGCEVARTATLFGHGVEDADLWPLVVSAGFPFITNDKGFSAFAYFSSISVPSVVLLRYRRLADESAVHGHLVDLVRAHSDPWRDFVASVDAQGYRVRSRLGS